MIYCRIIKKLCHFSFFLCFSFVSCSGIIHCTASVLSGNLSVELKCIIRSLNSVRVKETLYKIDAYIIHREPNLLANMTV